MIAPAPFTPKPSIIDRVLGRLFPTDQYGGLLEPTEQRALQRQGLLQLGTGLLADTGPGNALSALGRSYQGIDFGGMADHALQLQAYRQKLAQQAAVQGIVARHPAKPGEGTGGAYGRIAEIVSELAGQPGTEDLVGKLSNVLAQLKPAKAHWSLRAGLVDPRTGQPTRDTKIGVPTLLRVNDDTGDIEPTMAGAITPLITTPQRPPTSDQTKLADFATRMLEGNAVMTELENQVPGIGQNVDAKLRPFYTAETVPGLGPAISQAGLPAIIASMTPQERAYYGAMQDVVNARLRRVSGATINRDEYQRELRPIVPVSGEDQSVVGTKQKRRLQASLLYLRGAGNAFDPDLLSDAAKKYIPVLQPATAVGADTTDEEDTGDEPRYPDNPY